MVAPQCALKVSNFGFHTFTRVRCTRCVLAVLNFSQPQGTPTDGIIQSVQEGKLLHAELEDSLLMGYKVFGVRVDKETEKDITYTLRGDVRAYVQFQQGVPAGMHRLGAWPVEAFQRINPPPVESVGPVAFTSRELVARDLCELSPLIWRGRLCHMESVRPGTGGTAEDYYLLLRDAATGEEISRFAQGYGLASALVREGRLYVFASRWSPDGWHDVSVFASRPSYAPPPEGAHPDDPGPFTQSLAIEGENEQIFNTSVCADDEGFVMAYESNDPAYPAFTEKFARSRDLIHWRKVDNALLGRDRYAACPCIRYADGWYYVLYLEHRTPRWFFETYIARSQDLLHWERSAGNPVLTPVGLDEGINASDPELVEIDGHTWVYFAVGDQQTWMNIKRAEAPMPLADFLKAWFAEPGIPDAGSWAK
jgi:hypothetical protein